MTLTQGRLQELLSYDPETGEFRWVKPRRGVRVGDLCGRVSVHGYREICVDYRLYKAQRLAFVYMTGECPDGDIDHANRVKTDNRWANLRPATRSQNSANAGPRSNNTSGCPGVVWEAGRNKWRAQLRIDGRKTNLGRFATMEEAEHAHNAAAKLHFGVFAPQ